MDIRVSELVPAAAPPRPPDSEPFFSREPEGVRRSECAGREEGGRQKGDKHFGKPLAATEIGGARRQRDARSFVGSLLFHHI